MSSRFLVYVEDDDKPCLVSDDFAEALNRFTDAVLNADSAELKWSA
jgi:hypothetical protein